MRTIIIPACTQHEGLYSISVVVPWVCLYCGEPRGEPKLGLSFDGSRRLSAHIWTNPCGHVEKYSLVRERLGKE